jgi:FkbM family methyltransferase
MKMKCPIYFRIYNYKTKTTIMAKQTRFGIEFDVHEGTVFNIYGSIDGDVFKTGQSAEPETWKRIISQSHKERVFASCGGHLGEFELGAAKIYNHVYSLEPDPYCFAEFNRSIAMNPNKNITLEQVAIFDNTAGAMNLKIDPNITYGGSGLYLDRGSEIVTVPCTTLRNWFGKYQIPNKSVLMIDIEGVENVLFDDPEFFDQYRPTILIELHFCFMTTEQRKRLVNGLDRLKHVYDIDTSGYVGYTENHKHELWIPKI